MTQALQVVTVTVTGDRDRDIDLNLNWASQDTQIIITNTNRMSTSYIIILKIYFSVAKLYNHQHHSYHPIFIFFQSDYATFKLVSMKGKSFYSSTYFSIIFIQHPFNNDVFSTNILILKSFFIYQRRVIIGRCLCCLS